ncbi:hypothetical protein ACH5RR_039832 [Cinchona calisaya]|uniref:Uncharacterized protein n=1 Tax=Cinchona calisaya TaxID=153742 RepID=A0ABD2Y2X7_9GENT
MGMRVDLKKVSLLERSGDWGNHNSKGKDFLRKDCLIRQESLGRNWFHWTRSSGPVGLIIPTLLVGLGYLMKGLFLGSNQRAMSTCQMENANAYFLKFLRYKRKGPREGSKGGRVEKVRRMEGVAVKREVNSFVLLT